MEENTLSERVSKFIRDKRRALGLSQREFAIKVFGDEKYTSYVTKIENGHAITLTTLSKILPKINSDIDFIEY